MDPNSVLLTFQLASFLGQAAGAGMLAVVLYGFHRIYRRDFHLQWAWSWAALAAYLAGSALDLGQSFRLDGIHPLRIAVAFFTLAAGYAHLVWLWIGASELGQGHLISRRAGRRLLGMTVAVVLISVLLFARTPGADVERLFLRFYIRSLAAAVVFAAAARNLWLGRPKKRIGPKILAGAFLLYALEQLHHFMIGVLGLYGGPYSPFLGFLDLLLLLLIGLGLILWILDEERDRVLNATRRIATLATSDALTGLPNPKTFRDRLTVALARARRKSHRLAVLHLDLDGTKTINDTFGYTFGDQLLRSVARRLERLLRGGETLARMVGDEFTVLLPVIDSREAAESMASTILEELRRPFRIHKEELYVTVSIGIGLYPEAGDRAEDLLKNAETAMYTAKTLGGTAYRIFIPEMSAGVAERLVIEHGLRRALGGDDTLSVFYQPEIHAMSGDVRSVEALLRWRHPREGLMTPHEFLYVIDHIGLAGELDRWVLARALRQLRDWHTGGMTRLSMSINLSAPQFQHPHLVPYLERLLREVELPASRLILEITEAMAMRDLETSLTVMQQLKRLGVRISIDDFGTGYSSLAYLRQLPVDILKIDRSFIQDLTQDPRATAIVDGMIALARELRIEVVAEGVETQEQFEHLREQGCHAVQGFLFCSPLDASLAEEWLREAPAELAEEWPGFAGSC